ncbi:endonuclease/exonuclease/phosphatase family protein [Georgenia sp. TF02-10]|uniref:endonuclease/exonuclease/phosphatase family protein n=1 Tax=Georgenia sp. TF02-10 TaxID=2917725 RepID=UPI001FA7FEBA|nr:endonuclease/exonuclease/phosphatase family protein [Georgenia sp. TF02-10]UNX53898.1 endonuclease/exonuclease/phosphatase family protein [Georgenia sp. TF02-10]
MRIVTFNILHGRSVDDGEVDLDRFADAVRTLDPDVLALQEVDRDQPRSHGADLTTVAAEVMGAVEHRFVATMQGTPDRWTAATGEEQPGAAVYGTALLSRYPADAWRVLSLPGPQQRVPVTFPGRQRPVLVQDEPRTALAMTVRTPAGPCTVVGTHLTFVPGWNTAQLRHLVRAVRDMTRPLLLMGDLNLAGGAPARTSGFRPLATAMTFPVDEPTEQLDHILADGDVRVSEPARSLRMALSDHRALTVSVELGPAAAEPVASGAGRTTASAASGPAASAAFGTTAAGPAATGTTASAAAASGPAASGGEPPA